MPPKFPCGIPELGSGICECGCGAVTNINRQGKYSRFIRGHAKSPPKSCGKLPPCEPKPCGCGCGELTSVWRGKPRRFIVGHHARGENNGRFGRAISEETRQKHKDASKRNADLHKSPATQPGWKHTDATKKKLADAHAKAKYAARTPRRGIIRKCKFCGAPYYRVISITQTGYCSLSCAAKVNTVGSNNPFYGRRHTEATKEKLRIASTAQRSRGPTLPTKLESALHQVLQEHDVEFLTEHPLGHFCVDVYVPKHKLVIFTDGCYWHACPQHYPQAKKPRNDNARIPYLTKCGYKVVIIWEHEIKDAWMKVQSYLMPSESAPPEPSLE